MYFTNDLKLGCIPMAIIMMMVLANFVTQFVSFKTSYDGRIFVVTRIKIVELNKFDRIKYSLMTKNINPSRSNKFDVRRKMHTSVL